MARSKYNVNLDNKEKRTYNGITFDSEGEMKMYRDFLLPNQEAGFIEKIELQKNYELIPKFEYWGTKVRPLVYRADFVVTFKCGRVLVLDFKGMPDASAKLKRKLFWNIYPDYLFMWVAYSKVDGGYRTYEYIQARRKERRALRKGA